MTSRFGATQQRKGVNGLGTYLGSIFNGQQEEREKEIKTINGRRGREFLREQEDNSHEEAGGCRESLGGAQGGEAVVLRNSRERWRACLPRKWGGRCWGGVRAGRTNVQGPHSAPRGEVLACPTWARNPTGQITLNEVGKQAKSHWLGLANKMRSRWGHWGSSLDKVVRPRLLGGSNI